MVDGRDVGVELSESEGTMADHLDLVVHAFEGSVGDTDVRPSQHAIEVIPDHSCKLLERLESGVAGPPEPLPQIRLRPTGLKILPELLEGLFEKIRLGDREIELQNLSQSLPFIRLEVPGVLDENPPAFLDREPFLRGQRGDDLAAHVIHRSREMLNDVESVEHHRRLGHMTPDTGQIGRPHVHADDLNGPRPPLAQPREELIYGLLLPILSDPDHLVPLQVIGHGQIPMPLSAADLVQTQDVEGALLLVRKAPLDGPLHGLGDVAPLQPQILGHLLIAHLPSQERGDLGEAVGDVHFFSPPKALSPGRSRNGDNPNETGHRPE